jgi:putative transposase
MLFHAGLPAAASVSATCQAYRPGKPTDNGPIESFNGSFRDECLNAHWFSSLAEAKDKIAAWLKDYNESRPHRALKNLAPVEYAVQLENGA